jgi:hypothetical protein
MASMSAGQLAERSTEVPAAARYEALGRIMIALKSCGAMAFAENLDWWPSAGGQEMHVEWQQGPFAYEVAHELRDDWRRPARKAANASLRDGAWDGVAFASPTTGYVHLTVAGVRVVLRALCPLGADEAARQYMAAHRFAGTGR